MTGIEIIFAIAVAIVTVVIYDCVKQTSSKEIEITLDKEIDWEERRYELAKAFLQGWAANGITDGLHRDIKDALWAADEFIKKLKEEKE